MVAGDEVVGLGSQRHLEERLVIWIGKRGADGARCDTYAV